MNDVVIVGHSKVSVPGLRTRNHMPTMAQHGIKEGTAEIGMLCSVLKLIAINPIR